jgi:hypothetical protein
MELMVLLGSPYAMMRYVTKVVTSGTKSCNGERRGEGRRV